MNNVFSFKISDESIKSIVGLDICTISCGRRQCNEAAATMQNHSDYYVSVIHDNCCLIIDKYHRRYFFYTKDTSMDDVVLVCRALKGAA